MDSMIEATRRRMRHGRMSEAMERFSPASFENLWKSRDESRTARSATAITWKSATNPITDRVDHPVSEDAGGGMVVSDLDTGTSRVVAVA